MKRFLRPKPQSEGIDITPLMDIVFQLLLFFILTSAFLQPSLPLDLPGSSREPEQAEADMVVSVDGNGRVFLNEDAVPAPIETIEPALRRLVTEKPDAVVILRGDRQVRYGSFFEILDTIRNVGIKTVNLAYEEQEQ
jgi:biopolymer transport protein ExbD